MKNKATARFIDGMVKNALGPFYNAVPWETTVAGEKFLFMTTKNGKSQRLSIWSTLTVYDHGITGRQHFPAALSVGQAVRMFSQQLSVANRRCQGCFLYLKPTVTLKFRVSRRPDVELSCTTPSGKRQKNPATIERHASDCFKGTDGGRAFLLDFPITSDQQGKAGDHVGSNHGVCSVRIFYANGDTGQLDEQEVNQEEAAVEIDVSAVEIDVSAAAPDDRPFALVPQLRVENNDNNPDLVAPISTVKNSTTVSPASGIDHLITADGPTAAPVEDFSVAALTAETPVGDGGQFPAAPVGELASGTSEPLPPVSDAPQTRVSNRSSFFGAKAPPGCDCSGATTATLSRFSTSSAERSSVSSVSVPSTSNGWAAEAGVDELQVGEDSSALNAAAGDGVSEMRYPSPGFSPAFSSPLFSQVSSY